ncbi:LOW QUALITY PROTEIN: cytoplasmic polyadenylation element-binding protein 2 [Brienomyrus brachyistius]|uniref:LOW QUALITY PROTEIN: cytoplasmic polyadenylation element-binding protein 2 n=1 Tax=Brienomyrus brachyistius TaxID=42636 RepID=UPI0020B23427|nr:LOW QUALITY PROTEIN: cytoplasmic polyadenylation element-binding protein 2 [Brienomyrus brachyistius]
MGDYGFGLLQTANIDSSSTVFGGGAFRSYASPSLASSARVSPVSPSGFTVSGSSCASVASSPFPFAAAQQRNMQDELLFGVTITQRQQQRHSPSTDDDDSSSDGTTRHTGAQRSGHGSGVNNNPDCGNQLGQRTRTDYDRLNQNQQQLPDFKSVNPEKFGQTQQICDLHQQRKKHQQIIGQQPQQETEFGTVQPPPPQGEVGVPGQKQQYPAITQHHRGSPESEHSSNGSPGRVAPLSTEDVDANVVTAASPSPSSANPNKVKIQMDSPTAHLINNGNGNGAASMLAGGLGAGFSSLPNAEMQSPHQNAGGSTSPTLPGFGTPWSVQTSSPPPPVTSSANPNHANAMNQVSGTEPDNSFYPGLPSSINPAFFQSFSPVSPNPCAGINVPGFGNPFSPQINVPQPQQSRRSPVSPQMHQQHQGAYLQHRNNYNQHQPMMKQSPWSSHQGGGWSSAGVSWGGVHGRDHRRGGGMGVPGTVNQISPMKKPFSSSVIAPPKFPRSTAGTAASLTPKSWMEDNVFRTDSNSNTLLPLQDRSRMYDSLNMHSLESSLIDIVRAEQDPMKGRVGFPHQGADNLLMLNGRSSLFPIDDGLLDDGHSNQGVPGVLGSPNCYPHQNGERIERFSRKVFVGGLPPDIDEDEITTSFRRFGHLVVDWPHKAESKSYFPPKGYAFLLFQEESSVQALIEACLEEDGKLYLCVSSPTIKDKPVQIRPWNLSDSDFVMDGSQPLDPRKTIFVGGVPRPLRAVELAMIMDRLYGGVCYAGIDTDPELKYPKGAGRVAFSNQQSYIAAISARFVQLQHGDIDKRVEVKPYVLDDQLCDECQGARCGGKFAPFFCANVTCLQYYCEFCWANIHSRAGREFHKPLVKEGADRPRQIHFRWN